ncbi:hypothetical protein WV31_10605 [Magnetospirillum sp. ME-1]|uniref:hypothetical protein n=1 Tax=Magnetospirillum sp. ME-1 TaxID=1639348 RepID=UPI000A17B601|nr:hypothetical protein [Magnetospirillum sp. ME-1]ARJ66078.1 hypothetical protein WV31_10605 [Magnetospirillum sp. ME-1]
MRNRSTDEIVQNLPEAILNARSIILVEDDEPEHGASAWLSAMGFPDEACRVSFDVEQYHLYESLMDGVHVLRGRSPDEVEEALSRKLPPAETALIAGFVAQNAKFKNDLAQAMKEGRRDFPTDSERDALLDIRIPDFTSLSADTSMVMALIAAHLWAAQSDDLDEAQSQ